MKDLRHKLWSLRYSCVTTGWGAIYKTRIPSTNPGLGYVNSRWNVRFSVKRDKLHESQTIKYSCSLNCETSNNTWTLVTQRSAGLKIKRWTLLGLASLHVTVVKLRPKSQTCVYVFLHEGPIFFYWATFLHFGSLGNCHCPDKAWVYVLHRFGADLHSTHVCSTYLNSLSKWHQS